MNFFFIKMRSFMKKVSNFGPNIDLGAKTSRNLKIKI